MTKTILFDDLELELAPQTFEVGGAWSQEGTAHDVEGSVRFFYEKMLTRERVRFLDIGASTGLFCLLAKFHPNAIVLAYEPSPEPLGILKKNIILNNLGSPHLSLGIGEDSVSKVHISGFAIGGGDGPDKLKVPTHRWNSGVACFGDTPTRFSKWKEVKVEVRRLDTLLHPTAPVDIVKIDTEGCELFVLQGGEQFFTAQHPDILIEFNARNTFQFGYGPGKIIQLLNKFGYYHFEHVGMEDLWVSR